MGGFESRKKVISSGSFQLCQQMNYVLEFGRLLVNHSVVGDIRVTCFPRGRLSLSHRFLMLTILLFWQGTDINSSSLLSKNYYT
jgi:hypothetical protein